MCLGSNCAPSSGVLKESVFCGSDLRRSGKPTGLVLNPVGEGDLEAPGDLSRWEWNCFPQDQRPRGAIFAQISENSWWEMPSEMGRALKDPQITPQNGWAGGVGQGSGGESKSLYIAPHDSCSFNVMTLKRKPVCKGKIIKIFLEKNHILGNCFYNFWN